MYTFHAIVQARFEPFRGMAANTMVLTRTDMSILPELSSRHRLEKIDLMFAFPASNRVMITGRGDFPTAL
jgi:hypothetical protein